MTNTIIIVNVLIINILIRYFCHSNTATLHVYYIEHNFNVQIVGDTDLKVFASNSKTSSPGLSLGPGEVSCSWAEHFTRDHNAPLHPEAWGGGGNLAVLYHPIHPRVIERIISCRSVV